MDHKRWQYIVILSVSISVTLCQEAAHSWNFVLNVDLEYECLELDVI